MCSEPAESGTIVQNLGFQSPLMIRHPESYPSPNFTKEDTDLSIIPISIIPTPSPLIVIGNASSTLSERDPGFHREDLQQFFNHQKIFIMHQFTHQFCF
jgi:hypothetical protein